MVAAPWRSHLLLCAGGARACAVAQESLLSPRWRIKEVPSVSQSFLGMQPMEDLFHVVF